MARKDADEFANDPNWLAYQKALSSGQFKNVKPGNYVAYVDGQLVATGTFEQILEATKGKGAMVHQVNTPEEVIDMPIVFHIRGPRTKPF